eukprot:contig_4585_g988
MPGVAVEKEADGTLAADEVPVGIGALVADDSGSYDAAIRAQLYPLLELTGVLRDNVGDGGMHAEYQYQSLATRIFSLYEVLDDAARSVPILERRKNSRTGRFNSTRLGALQQFVLGVGGAGLSVREQKQLYDFLEIWDRRDAVDPMETRDDLSLSAVFPTVSSFTKALRDDLDDAVLSAGWKKLKIREGGTVYEVYYRSVLEVVMARLQKVRVRLVNDDTGDIHWMTVAYIPLVRIQVEKAAKERSRLRRCGILQRVLYVCMRTAMAASRFGVEVLDLGVTRMLVQWLVEVFPKICKGHMPLAGTDAATRRVCNKRIDHLGRRSKACKTPPGYLVKHDEPQSVYTGKQQREGVSTMAFLVAGAWRTRGALPVPALPVRGGVAEIGEAALPVGDGLQDAVPDLAARVAALRLDEAPEEGAASDDPASVAGGPEYDWSAYHAVWGETPIDEAITAMFAEFAVLHAEMYGYTCSTAPMPLTLNAGKCIADRAQCFVTQYLTPILGPQHSSKVHRLLCHVMDAIRMHGNINNGNAGINERMHKEDKPYYSRTNKSISDFTRQLVVQAQGAHIILRRNAEEEEDRPADVLACGDESSDGEGLGPGLTEEEEAPGIAAGGASAPDGAANAPGFPGPGEASTAGVAVVAAVGTPAYHLRRVRLSAMSQWPGMAGVAAALDLPEDARVRVSSRIAFKAVFECGTTATQLLYASPSFRGEPWYDFVMYSSSGNASTLSVAEVRAIVRRPGGDFVVVADMVSVPGVPGCPLVARGCTRLAWSVPDGETDVCLRTMPLESIRRVLHVVPDFADLSCRRGLDAEPAKWGDPVEERLAMRFFINAFYPWGS